METNTDTRLTLDELAAAYDASRPIPVVYAAQKAAALGRKFVDEDLMGDPMLRQAAVEYVATYTGDFDYMRDLRSRKAPLSVGQLRGALNVLRAAAVKAMPAPPAPVTDEAGFAAIGGLFATAAASLKHPRIRLMTGDGAVIVLTVAGQTARVPGSINVTSPGSFSDRTWYGRIHSDGRWEPSRMAPSSLAATLADLAADPAAAAAAYGRMTGYCCFCERELTDARSVAVGYGPICAGHYGLPWGQAAEVEQEALVAVA